MTSITVLTNSTSEQTLNYLESDQNYIKKFMPVSSPVYIKSQSKSKWSKLIEEVHQIYKSIFDGLTNTEFVSVYELRLDMIASEFADQLILEENKLNTDQKITDCGLFAPRSGSTYNRSDRPIRFSYYIIQKIFMDTNRIMVLEHAIKHYNKLCSRLSSKYVEQYRQEEVLNHKFKMNRLLEHNRGNWCCLRNRPLSNKVSDPTAMKVEEAPLEELEPFFTFLDSDKKIIATEFIREEYCKTFCRGAVYEDGRMDLCKQVVGPSWISNLMRSLVPNTQIKHFLLGNNIIGPNGGKAIKEFLLNPNKKPHIETWYLAGNDLNDDAISDIVDGLVNDPDVKYLWLKRNPIKANGIQHITRLLKSNSNIEVLDLHNTAVFDEGLEYLIEGLKSNTSVKLLYLDANNITSKSIDHLTDYYEYLISNDLNGVNSLWIDMNNLGDQGISSLVRTLGRYPYLERLNLGSNMMTDISVGNVVNAFKDHQSLKVLDIGMYKSTGDMGLTTNNIGTKGAIILAELIKTNQSIQFLSINMNGIESDGIEVLAKSLESNKTLLYFEYEQYGVYIDQKTRQSIKTILETNRENNSEYNRYIRSRSNIGSNTNKYSNYLRVLKHTDKVRYIDSIYRNSSK